jgi:hypothetical protein
MRDGKEDSALLSFFSCRIALPIGMNPAESFLVSELTVSSWPSGLYRWRALETCVAPVLLVAAPEILPLSC